MSMAVFQALPSPCTPRFAITHLLTFLIDNIDCFNTRHCCRNRAHPWGFTRGREEMPPTHIDSPQPRGKGVSAAQTGSFLGCSQLPVRVPHTVRESTLLSGAHTSSDSPPRTLTLSTLPATPALHPHPQHTESYCPQGPCTVVPSSRMLLTSLPSQPCM